MALPPGIDAIGARVRTRDGKIGDIVDAGDGEGIVVDFADGTSEAFSRRDVEALDAPVRAFVAAPTVENEKLRSHGRTWEAQADTLMWEAQLRAEEEFVREMRETIGAIETKPQSSPPRVEFEEIGATDRELRELIRAAKERVDPGEWEDHDFSSGITLDASNEILKKATRSILGKEGAVDVGLEYSNAKFTSDRETRVKVRLVPSGENGVVRLTRRGEELCTSTWQRGPSVYWDEGEGGRWQGRLDDRMVLEARVSFKEKGERGIRVGEIGAARWAMVVAAACLVGGEEVVVWLPLRSVDSSAGIATVVRKDSGFEEDESVCLRISPDSGLKFAVRKGMETGSTRGKQQTLYDLSDEEEEEEEKGTFLEVEVEEEQRGGVFLAEEEKMVDEIPLEGEGDVGTDEEALFRRALRERIQSMKAEVDNAAVVVLEEEADHQKEDGNVPKLSRRRVELVAEQEMAARRSARMKKAEMAKSKKAHQEKQLLAAKAYGAKMDLVEPVLPKDRPTSPTKHHGHRPIPGSPLASPIPRVRNRDRTFSPPSPRATLSVPTSAISAARSERAKLEEKVRLLEAGLRRLNQALRTNKALLPTTTTTKKPSRPSHSIPAQELETVELDALWRVPPPSSSSKPSRDSLGLHERRQATTNAHLELCSLLSKWITATEKNRQAQRDRDAAANLFSETKHRALRVRRMRAPRPSLSKAAAAQTKAVKAHLEMVDEAQRNLTNYTAQITQVRNILRDLRSRATKERTSLQHEIHALETQRNRLKRQLRA